MTQAATASYVTAQNVGQVLGIDTSRSDPQTLQQLADLVNSLPLPLRGNILQAVQSGVMNVPARGEGGQDAASSALSLLTSMAQNPAAASAGVAAPLSIGLGQATLAGQRQPQIASTPQAGAGPQPDAGPSAPATLDAPAGPGAPPAMEPGAGVPTSGYNPRNPAGSTDLAPEEWDYLSQVLGTDARQSFFNFQKQYTLALQPVAPAGLVVPAGTPMTSLQPTGQTTTAAPTGSTTAAAGITAGAKTYAQAAQDYLSKGLVDQGWQLTAQPTDTGVSAAMDRRLHEQQPAPTPRQWANYIGTSAQGIAYFVAQRLSEDYAFQNGQPMPADLRSSIVQAIQGMDDQSKTDLAAQYALYSQMLTKSSTDASVDLSKYAVKVPQFVQDLETSYLQAHPTPGQEQQLLLKRVSSYMSSLGLGRPATLDDLAALGQNPTDIQIQQYVDNQPSPINGMNYGRYSTVNQMLTAAGWAKYFGHDPTQGEIMRASGWNPDDVNNYIQNSPSRVHGVSIGRYNDIVNQATTITQQQWGMHPDDSMVKELHDMLGQQ